MSESRIARLLKLDTHPVAVIRTDRPVDNALSFREGRKGCLVALLAACALKGRTALFSPATTACPGGCAGLGFKPMPEANRFFLSVGSEGGPEGEHYKKSPETALQYIQGIARVEPSPYVVFRPLEELGEDETPDAVVFFANADRISALATLANYDSPRQDNVRLEFGAGCVQAVLYALQEEAKARKGEFARCVLGMTDISGRKVVPKDMLTFSIPWTRFLEMEANAEGSFLTGHTWARVSARD